MVREQMLRVNYVFVQFARQYIRELVQFREDFILKEDTDGASGFVAVSQKKLARPPLLFGS